jgi:NhaP-type Na+/H+ or K+/H+ antiporter
MTVQADEADVIGELVIYFVGFVIVLGAVVTYAQYLVPTRFAFFKEMPYVVVIFILGFVIGISVSKTGNGPGNGLFAQTSLVWENFPPELLIYMFIPVLIYEEVTNLNLHHFKTTVGQGLVLAFPAAIFGTFILGAIINANGIPFPVDWGTNGIYLFASILCATDSVSVVSLLSKMELFRSQKLKYIIINESLFNDATALVLYTVFLSAEIDDVYEATFTASRAVIYAVKVIVFSPLIGLAFGVATVLFMYLIGDPHN